MGLLHALTSDAGWWRDQNLIFTLLDIADGFNDRSNFSGMSYEDRRKVEGERQKIAKKAFAVLCTVFFDGGKPDQEDRRWWWLDHDTLFQKVLWFLRPGEYSWIRLSNIAEARGEAETYYREVYMRFVFDLAKLGWSKLPRYERERTRSDEEQRSMRERLLSAGPDSSTSSQI